MMNYLQVIFLGVVLGALGFGALYVSVDQSSDRVFRRLVMLGFSLVVLGCVVVFMGLGMVQA